MKNKDGTRNKLVRKISAALLSAAMVITGISASFVYANSEEAPILISKTADWGETAQDKDAGIAKVNLTVKAKDIETSIQTPLTTRVVLVLDISSSMNYNRKLEKMRTAAENFCKELLKIERVEIAVVEYGEGSRQLCGFKDRTKQSELLATIRNIQKHNNEGTNIQSGIAKAQELLNGVTADNEIMIVLSDGEPTYSFMGTEAIAADNSYNYDSQTWPYRLTAFNTTRLGSGNNYNLRAGYELKLAGEPAQTARINNNGFGTVSQAYAAKSAGTTIYSVGFDISSSDNAKKVMNSIASEPSKALRAETENLEIAFDDIKGSIIKSVAGTSAVVTDRMGSSDVESNEYSFKALTDDAHKPQISGPEGVTGAGVTYDDLTDTFTWNLASGELKQGTYTLSYYVKLNLEDMTGSYGREVREVLTNNSAQLKYTDSSACEQTLDFEKPSLPLTHYSVEYYYSDDSGKKYSKDASKTLTFAAVEGCTNKTATQDMINSGTKSGFDFEPQKTRYGTGDDENTESLSIRNDENKNVIRLYYKKYNASGSVTLKAHKNYNALLQDKDFEFSAVETDSSGTPLDAATKIKAFNNPDGDVIFPEQNFDESDIGKTRYYKMTEEADPLRPFISFSGLSFVAEVCIKDSAAHDGRLTTETTFYRLENGQKTKLESGEIPLFTNTYNLQPAEISLRVHKRLSGKTLEANQFAFLLTETESSGKVLENGVTQTVRNKADGSIDFNKIAFTGAGTHYYLIKEENGGKEISRIRYDDLSILVRIKVEDDGAGNLRAKVDYPEDITFDNTYVKPDTPPTPPPASKGSIEITKTVTSDGKPVQTDRVFFVALFADEEHKTPASPVKEIRMDSNCEASVTFSDLSYGTYYLAETDSSGHALSPAECEAAGFNGVFSQNVVKVSGTEKVQIFLENKLIPDSSDPGEGTIDDPGENVEDDVPTKPEIVPISAPVMTGDESALLLWIPILVIALSALAAAVIIKRKAR